LSAESKLTQSSTDSSLVERLRPSYVVDAGLQVIVRALREHGCEAEAFTLNEWIVANNARKSEAADRISTLERELEEARLERMRAEAREKGTNAAVETLSSELKEARALNVWISTCAAAARADAEFHRDNAVTMWDAERARATAAEAKVALLTEALRPFAEAADSIDDNEGDRIEMWEHPASMQVTAADFRAARSALQSEKDREGEDGR
jgi:hypothetical protein